MSSSNAQSCGGVLQEESDARLSRSRDLRSTRIPRYGIALIEALSLAARDCESLETLNESEWHSLLKLSDATQVTLLLGRSCRPFLPDWIRDRIDRNYQDNAYRFERL